MMTRNFNMIITIKNDDGESVYDVSKIEDEQRRAGANVSISKIGTLNVLVEALNYASQGHQNNLEVVLKESPEAVVEQDDEEETSTEEESLNEVSSYNSARCKSLATFLMEIECNKKELNLLNTNYPALNVVAVMLYLSMRMALLNALVVIHSLQIMTTNQQER